MGGEGMLLGLSVLSMSPKIWKENGKLIARTSGCFALFTFWLHWRKVVIDPKHQKVIITRRSLWFWEKRRVMPFRFSESIAYGYNDVSGTSDWGGAGQTFDVFRISLRLADQETVPLFSFFGRGSFVNNSVMPDWWYWSEYTTSMSGTQEQESRLYAELLKRMIGKPLSA
jgi:hypothetical protein